MIGRSLAAEKIIKRRINVNKLHNNEKNGGCIHGSHL